VRVVQRSRRLLRGRLVFLSVNTIVKYDKIETTILPYHRCVGGVCSRSCLEWEGRWAGIGRGLRLAGLSLRDQ
jgi:hypothetical protein